MFAKTKKKKGLMLKKEKTKNFKIASCTECPFSKNCRTTFGNSMCNSKRKKYNNQQKAAA